MIDLIKRITIKSNLEAVIASTKKATTVTGSYYMKVKKLESSFTTLAQKQKQTNALFKSGVQITKLSDQQIVNRNKLIAKSIAMKNKAIIADKKRYAQMNKELAASAKLRAQKQSTVIQIKKLETEYMGLYAIKKKGITLTAKEIARMKVLRAEYIKAGGSMRALQSSHGGLLKSFTRARWMLVNVTMGIALLAGAFRVLGPPILELETEMKTVQKRTKMTDESIRELEKDILHLSRTIPGSATELAKIAAVAGQLGIRGSKNIMEFTRVTAMMAASTVMNSEEAALAIAKISKAYGLPIREAEKIGSVINELSNTTAANSKEISAAVLKMAASANIFGISMQTASAIGATLIDMGMKAERAGTRMKTVFTRMSTETEDIRELLGMTPDEVRLGLVENPEEMFNRVLEKLSEFENKQDAITTATKLFGRVGATAVLGLVSNYDALRRNTIAASDEFKRATSLQNEFNIAMASTTNQWKLYWQQVSASWTESMSGTNKAMGAWLQKINTRNTALRETIRLMKEIKEENEKDEKPSERSLTTEIFDKSWIRATTGPRKKINSTEDRDAQLEEFKGRMKNMGWDSLTDMNILEWDIKFYTEIGELDKAKERLQDLENIVIEEKKIPKLPEEEMKSFIDRLMEQQAIMNDMSQEENWSNALTKYNEIIAETTSLHEDDIAMIMKRSGAIREQTEDIIDQTAQYEYAYDFLKNKLNKELQKQQDIYNDYKKVKFDGEDEETKKLHELELAIKKQTLAEMELGDVVNKTNEAFKKDEYSAWADTINQHIKSAIENGNLLGENVSDSIKKYQTTLMATSKFSEKSSDKEKTALEKLEDERKKAQLEFEINYGEKHYLVDQAIKDMENEGDIIASSAKEAIEMLEKQKNRADELKDAQETMINQYDAEKDAIKRAELGLDAATVSALENQILQQAGIQATIDKYNELNTVAGNTGGDSDSGSGGSSSLNKYSYWHDYKSGVSGTIKAKDDYDFLDKLEDKYGHQDWYNKKDFSWKELALGGLVTEPTRALIGEAGPEMVVPLTGPNAGSGAEMAITIENVNVTGISGDPNAFAYEFAKSLRRELRTL